MVVWSHQIADAPAKPMRYGRSITGSTAHAAATMTVKNAIVTTTNTRASRSQAICS